MTDARLNEVLERFEKAADEEDKDVGEKDFYDWADAQGDSEEIYGFFTDFVNGLIADTKASKEKEEIEAVRLKLIKQDNPVET